MCARENRSLPFILAFKKLSPPREFLETARRVLDNGFPEMQLPGAGELGAHVAGRHQADVPDLHVLSGQHVIDEAAEERLAGQRDRLAVLGAEGDESVLGHRPHALDGDPTAMGWESQAVHLVPMAQLPSHASHANDLKILAALADHLAQNA